MGIEKTCSIKYSKSIILNLDKKFPQEMSFLDIGRIYRVLYFISYNNSVKYYSSNNVSFMEYLELTNYKNYRKFIVKLSKYNIIKEFILIKEKEIILNPIYAFHNNFILEQFHIDLFGEELVGALYNRITDLNLLVKYKHLIPEFEYQKMEFKLNPDKYYKVYNNPIDLDGIYLLYNNSEIVYVGKSNNIENRIKQHKKDKEFDSVKWVVFKDAGLINLYEPYFIQKYSPKYNKDLLQKTNFELPEIIL